MKVKEKYYENEILKLLKEYNENYGLLSEAKSKLETLIKTLGMAEGSAKILDDIFGPLSVWMANKIGKYNLKVEPNTYSSLEKAISNIYLETEYYTALLKTIKEYIEFELGGDKTSLNNVDFDDITNIAKDWKKNSGEFNYKEDEEYIILDFRKNGIGYYWIDLNTDNSNQECNRMGHCGRSSSGSLYSLRSFKPTPGKKYTINDSHLTAAIDDYGVLYQLKGKKNSKPKEEYHKYIIALLEYKKPDDDYLINQFGNEYNTGNDFKLTDLSDNDFLKLYEVRPELYEYGGISVYNKLKEFGININLTLDTAYDLQFDYDRIHFLLKDDEEVYQEKIEGVWYRDQKRNVYMSEVVLKRDLDRFSDYVINNLIPMSWMDATSHISYENKNKIIELLKILAKKQNKEFILTDLNNAIEEYDNYEQISMAIDDAILRSTQEEAMDEFRGSLIETLEHYGYVDEYSDQISIEGDLTNLVDTTNESVIKAFEWVENKFDDDRNIVETVFYRLLDKDEIKLATWEYPTIELNEAGFNFWLKEKLDYNLKDSIKENYNDRKVSNLLKQYNNKFGLINEAKSKLDILINTLGADEANAKILDEIFGPLSVWMAKKFSNYNSNFWPKDYPTPKDVLRKADLRIFRSAFTSIKDYIVVGLNGNKSSLDNLDYKEIYDKSKEWHDSLNVGDGDINYQETHPIIIDFRKDGEGYYWVDLETKNSDEECKRMGHCGRSSYGFLYSLRSDKKIGKYKLNRSHLTAAIGDGILYQLKGPKNSKPKEEYHKYIEPLFFALGGGGEEEDYLIQGFGSEYASRDDFKLEDLPIETLKELYQDRPELFKSRGLQSKMKELGIEIEVEKIPTTFELTEIGFDGVFRLIKNDTEVGVKTININSLNRRDIPHYLSEIVLSKDIDKFRDYYEENIERLDWQEALEYLTSINKSRIINIFKKLDSLLEINSFPNKENDNFNTSELINLFETYDESDDIKQIIWDALGYSGIVDAMEEYKDSLITALENYGQVYIQTRWEQIGIQGDLDNLVNMDSEKVQSAIDYVENEYEPEDLSYYAEYVFDKLLVDGVIRKATWEYPKIELNGSEFNINLAKELVYLEKNIVKEDFNNKKIVNILKEYNNKFGLINEAKSKLDILINKVGFSEPIAKVFDELCGSLSVKLANKLFKHYVQRAINFNVEGNMTKEEIKEFALREINNLSTTLLRNILVPIMDYIRVGLNGDISSLENDTWQQVYEKQKQWHDSLNIGDGAINYEETHPIIIDFRKDGEGYYWVDLETKNSDEECKRMGHCGRSSYGFLYSLRSDKKLPGGKFKLNRSHLTAAIGTDGIMYQLKGPKNSKPKEEYHQYITPLFSYEDDGEYLIQGFGTEYASQQDFKLSDLPNETIRELYNERPELFNTRGLQRKLGELGIIEVPPLQTKFVEEFNPKDVPNYLDGDYTYRTYKKKTPAGNEYTVRVSFYEKIMSEDVWDMWHGNPNWEDGLEYYINSTNEKKIEEMIHNWMEKKGIEIDDDMSLKEKIEEYDENYDIRSAISGCIEGCESDSYVEYLRDGIKDALAEYGKITEYNYDIIKIEIDLKNLFTITKIDEYFETYEDCNDNPKCLFGALLDEGSIDKPIPSYDDRWYPDVDKKNFNECLTKRLNEI